MGWGSTLRKVFARLVAASMLALGMAGLLAGGASAHGFHCRSMLGWDPVAGVYRYHRHEGICRNYKRCLRKQKRCVFLLGRGFQRWSYEAFGYDNERFTRCMVRAGCY